MAALDEIYALFRESMPFIIRNEMDAKGLLSRCHLLEERENDSLVGAAAVYEDAVELLCVKKECRGKGVGSRLLTRAEEIIRQNGYAIARAGVSGNGLYLMPGVPTGKPYGRTINEGLDSRLTEEGRIFFEKRGYAHSWDCDCFDMLFNLQSFHGEDARLGETVEGITYRMAKKEEIPAVAECVADAEEHFVQYYLDESKYAEGGRERAMIALEGEKVAGALLIETDTGVEGLGSVGCTAVRRSHQGRKIATRMIMAGTRYLKDQGKERACLGYTYTGLDKLYGYAGYRISVYYMMAEKRLMQ